MNDKPSKWKAFKAHFLSAEQARYVASLKTGQLETFDLSWPCITARKIVATDDEIIAHNSVVAIFRRMGVR
ncbi:hypothetical protein FQP85_22010 [Pseudoalteromonas neustonica]|uniref:Uncharacterized protein n=1 Tax=Pseudoalteromonas neustonica TaxID=1840331 RepID=A0ABY3F7C5_9GAMM|nr:hypothetical protein [Pseudoalteromonas neustonica]TVU79870.1 hypothetical protein FQP85_22010 [Pseudoalteromonas neustonica]